jgi:hypothetical protein
LILDSVRDTEPESVYSDEELLNGLRNNLKEQGNDPDEILKKAEKNGMLFGILAKLKDDVTLQWILEHSKVME